MRVPTGVQPPLHQLVRLDLVPEDGDHHVRIQTEPDGPGGDVIEDPLLARGSSIGRSVPYSAAATWSAISSRSANRSVDEVSPRAAEGADAGGRGWAAAGTTRRNRTAAARRRRPPTRTAFVGFSQGGFFPWGV
jgi:hypothetical protein